MASLDEIERSLPNGFHDAELQELLIDYANSRAVLRLRVDMSAPEADRGDRAVELRLKGLAFAAIEPPRSEEPLTLSGSLWIDAGPGKAATFPGELPAVPEGSFLHWLYVRDWNAFIHIAARDAELVWTEPS